MAPPPDAGAGGDVVPDALGAAGKKSGCRGSPCRRCAALTDHVVKFIKENTYSDNTTLAVFQGLRIPQEAEDYGRRAKREIFKIEDARKVADHNDIRIIEVTGKRGTIGAVAGVGCFDMGWKAAALPEDTD
jgi:tRNA(Ile2) C34 agmatinyltransferase TiaS